ncbi:MULTISPECIES: response regulator [Aequorivita]|uniref:Response regulator n=1 Tax=Aequorivita iocasae TaxID=2803865 RepID=A0ABX7DTS2_9FLAO|nr:MULTISPECIES: response regulator [Aequorivita]QQX76174.1 response regulator [Aequorivita iocasae]UCA55634.1 response regulator [Aequorivita sp. F7]
MKSVLVIDDNISILENIQAMLELAGYKVKSATNGEKGVALAEAMMPDIILCDIVMPGMDGFEVLRKVRSNNRIGTTPFIFLSALNEKHQIRKGMNVGADDFLTKPFDEAELIEAIESRLQRIEFLKKDFFKSHIGINSFFKEASQFVKFESLTENRDWEEYNAQEIIFREGRNAHKFYFVHTGSVKTYKTTTEGKEFITGIYGPGDFFGQISLINKKGQYLDTAFTLKKSKLIGISKDDFNNILHSNNEVSNKFIDIISNNLIEIQDQLINMAYAPVRKRAAKALLLLDAKNSKSTLETVAIRIQREDFASMIGTATETAIRSLSEFREEGLIKMDVNHDIHLVDKEELQYIAETE